MEQPDKKIITLSSTVPTELDNQRLDRVLASLFPSYSRSLQKTWILAHQVQVDHTVISKPRHKVQADQTLTVEATLEPHPTWEGQAIPLDILFEDDHLIVINKPAGMICHPGAGNPDRTLVNALMHHNPATDTLPRAGLIHRLDKGTSGLLIAAKTLPCHTALTQAMQQRQIKREYEAIAEGKLIAGNTIEAPIGRHPQHRTKMAVVKQGKPAITHYRILTRFKAYTHVAVILETGRTHQIRVHFQHIRHPLIGDRCYQPRYVQAKGCSPDLQHALQHFHRQALHARRLSFTHPVTDETLTVEAPKPLDFEQLLQALQTNELQPNDRTPPT